MEVLLKGSALPQRFFNIFYETAKQSQECNRLNSVTRFPKNRLYEWKDKVVKYSFQAGCVYFQNILQKINPLAISDLIYGDFSFMNI